MALTDAQKVTIRRHLGLNSAAEANYPFVPTFFSVTQVLDTLPSASEGEVVSILDRLGALEDTLDEASTQRIKAAKLGNLTLRSDEADKLWIEIKRWRRELSTVLGVPCQTGGGILVT